MEPLFNSFHNLEVVIAGDDRVAYGGRVPKEGSFGLWARQKLAPWYKRGLVRFVGHLPVKSYARLLKSSHVHCYQLALRSKLEFARCYVQWMLPRGE